MKRIVLTLSLVFVIVGALSSNLWAGELDVLLDKLVDKGIISPVEATIIKDETKQLVASEVNEGKSYAVPEWVQKMKIKGDLRLRYEYTRSHDDTEARTRGRIRYRMGFITEPVDKVEVGAGLATGGDDLSIGASTARSTNTTFEDFFARKPISLDYAYAQYTHNKYFKAIAGKFDRKIWLWTPTDMLWDSDVTPEGLSILLERDLVGDISGWLSTGLWALDLGRTDDATDRWMKVVQGGISGVEGIFDFKAAATHYAFSGLQDIPTGELINGSAATNTRGANGLAYKYDFDSVGASAEVGVNKPFGGLPFNMDERIAFFADFIHNVDPDSANNGTALGMVFGHSKLKVPGSWQLKFVKAKLGRDAFPDFLPDSDRLSGATDVKSYEILWDYQLMNNITFGLDYYKSRALAQSNTTKDDLEHLVQADVVVKF